MVRSYVNWLVQDKKFGAVLERVPAVTAGLMRNPPLAGTWVERAHVVPIVVAVDALYGKAGVRRMSKATVGSELMEKLRPALAALLRIFGTSPATIYRRTNDMLKASMEGVECKFTSTSERSGIFELRYDLQEEVPMCSFVTFMATLEYALEVCSARGTVSEPERIGPAAASYRIIW
jgi:hypothetical protein